ncbi:MAG: SDR family NAD(P)-dependent oxidoreductase [Solirubrobacteraceae bacterium]
MPSAFQGEARVGLITGAAGGIGSALGRRLAGELPGLALAYGHSGERAEQLAAELGADGREVRAFQSDMLDREGPAQLLAAVEAALGAVDVLVVNHGVAEKREWQDVDAAAFDRTLAINLRAPFLLARAALPKMVERGFGRVLFISSVAAFRGGVVGPDYAASKAGLHGVVHFLASRVARSGVTVNAIAPGFIETPMLPGHPEQLAGNVPVGRVGRPEEVAELALAVLANGFLTSQVVGIDGGMYPR